MPVQTLRQKRKMRNMLQVMAKPSPSRYKSSRVCAASDFWRSCDRAGVTPWRFLALRPLHRHKNVLDRVHDAC